jgi:amino acid transporter
METTFKDYLLVLSLYAFLIILILLNLTDDLYPSLARAQLNEPQNLTNSLQRVEDLMLKDLEDMKNLRNLTLTEIQSLNALLEGVSKSSTQAVFIAVLVFFIGVALMVFGLRLTLKSAGELGKIFSIMMWALIIPVILILFLYQVSIASGNRGFIARSEEPFIIVTLILWIPTALVLFLLLGLGKLFRSKQQQQLQKQEDRQKS